MSHGQLYVALSRSRNQHNVKVRIQPNPLGLQGALLNDGVNSLATLSSTKFSNCNSSIRNNCVFQSSSRAKLLYSCFFFIKYDMSISLFSEWSVLILQLPQQLFIVLNYAVL